jgi:hypothetical protein
MLKTESVKSNTIRARFVFILLVAILGVYLFVSWLYAYHSFPDHPSRVAAYLEITPAWMSGVCWQLAFIGLNVLALFLTGLSRMKVPTKTILTLWLVFATLLSIWSLL